MKTLFSAMETGDHFKNGADVKLKCRMKKGYLFSVQILMVLSLAFVAGCSKNDNNGSDGGSGGIVPDPAGTMTKALNSSSEARAWLDIGSGRVALTYTSNLFADNCDIAYYGQVNGLGNVTKIPQGGWTDTAAAEDYTAYVVRMTDGTYGRIFISDLAYGTHTQFYAGTYYTIDEYSANVKYQYPFKP